MSQQNVVAGHQNRRSHEKLIVAILGLNDEEAFSVLGTLLRMLQRSWRDALHGFFERLEAEDAWRTTQ